MRKYGTQCHRCGADLGSTKYIDDGHAYCSRDCLYGQDSQSFSSPHVLGNDDSTWNGVYENITSTPIRITGGRRELISVCNQYGVAAKALLKPRSQGSGYEMRTRRF